MNNDENPASASECERRFFVYLMNKINGRRGNIEIGGPNDLQLGDGKNE
ncbi:hypothetical protein [Paenibacillus harenae]|nr:hypothetical protein [Paenibacillus harenae]